MDRARTTAIGHKSTRAERAHLSHLVDAERRPVESHSGDAGPAVEQDTAPARGHQVTRAGLTAGGHARLTAEHQQVHQQPPMAPARAGHPRSREISGHGTHSPIRAPGPRTAATDGTCHPQAAHFSGPDRRYHPSGSSRRHADQNNLSVNYPLSISSHTRKYSAIPIMEGGINGYRG